MSLRTLALISGLAVSSMFLSACSPKNESDISITTPRIATMDDIIAHPRREAEAARDQFRHPKETLEFFGLEPGQNVVEIWPGWYTKIIAPYIAQHGGSYTAALYPESMGERFQKRIAAYKETFSQQDDYGTITYSAFGPDTGPIAPEGSADLVLTFRNVHNWMGKNYAEKAFKDFYDVLKPGGILGVVEHRLPETAVQDPRGANGYVQESYIKALAEEAGFEFLADSEINANARDTADHPFGVWTLPPASRLPKEGQVMQDEFNPVLYKNIGESDRSTLKFRKPY